MQRNVFLEMYISLFYPSLLEFGEFVLKCSKSTLYFEHDGLISPYFDVKISIFNELPLCVEPIRVYLLTQLHEPLILYNYLLLKFPHVLEHVFLNCIFDFFYFSQKKKCVLLSLRHLILKLDQIHLKASDFIQQFVFMRGKG